MNKNILLILIFFAFYHSVSANIHMLTPPSLSEGQLIDKIMLALQNPARRQIERYYEEAFRYKTAWDLLKESGLVPCFISTEHVMSLAAIQKAEEKRIIKYQDTVIVNFDKHNDIKYGFQYADSSNWAGAAQQKGASYIWFDGKTNLVENFTGNDLLDGKDIVISIDIDYFENVPKEELGNAMHQLAGFLYAHSDRIKMVTIATSPDYCSNIDPETILSVLLNVLDIKLIPEGHRTEPMPYLNYSGCVELHNSEIAIELLHQQIKLQNSINTSI
jgi:hypothetical protein